MQFFQRPRLQLIMEHAHLCRAQFNRTIHHKMIHPPMRSGDSASDVTAPINKVLRFRKVNDFRRINFIRAKILASDRRSLAEIRSDIAYVCSAIEFRISHGAIADNAIDIYYALIQEWNITKSEFPNGQTIGHWRNSQSCFPSRPRQNTRPV